MIWYGACVEMKGRTQQIKLPSCRRKGKEEEKEEGGKRKGGEKGKRVEEESFSGRFQKKISKYERTKKDFAFWKKRETSSLEPNNMYYMTWKQGCLCRMSCRKRC